MTPPTVVSVGHVHRSVVSTRQVRSGLVLASLSLAIIAAATLLPEKAQPATMSPLCLICGSRGGVDAVLNVFLFVPLGVGLSLLRLPPRRAVIAMCALSAAIEILQLAVIVGRDPTFGDFVTNSLGGALGFAIAHHRGSWSRPSRKMAMALAFSWAGGWLALQVAVAFAFAPVFPVSQYYGQIARSFKNLATFRGKVVDATIGPVSVPDFAISNSAAIRDVLRNGGPVRALVITARPTAGVAPILRVADSHREEVVLLSQRKTDFVFGVRTGATILRLRPPLYAIPGAFPATLVSLDKIPPDTILISGNYLANAVTMKMRGQFTSMDMRYPISASAGWMIFSPVQWYATGSAVEQVVDLLWTALLVLPLGYWGTCFSRESCGQRATKSNATVTMAAAAILGVGFVLVPYLFGQALPSYRAWIGFLCGLGTGCLIARRLRAEFGKSS